MTVSPSLFDRLARNPANRVTNRLAERFPSRQHHRSRVCWRLGHRFCSSSNDMSEKQPKKPRHWLNVFATTNRVWQTISSLVMFSSYTYFVFNVKSDTAPSQIRLAAIEGIAIASIAYHINVLLLVFLLRKSRESRGWRFFAYSSIVADFWMMGLAMSKLSILSAAGVTAPCNSQNEMNIFKTVISNGAAFARNRFGWGAHHNHAEIDIACCLPKVIYTLCGIAIFSYTFSVLFTGMQLQRTKMSDEQSTHLGHIEEAIPERPQRSRTPEFQYPHNLPPPMSRVAAPVQVFSVTIPAQSSPTPRGSTSEDLPRYASMDEAFSMPRGRLSQETTSSFNPDLYLVSDGFRPQPELPNYSRPPSYRSGPPSIRNL